MALVDIPVHGEIVRYGEVIGYAVRDIPRGSWIDESMVELPKAPPLETLPLATKVPEPLPPLEVIPSKVTAMLTVALAPEPARHLHQRALRGGRGGLCGENH